MKSDIGEWRLALTRRLWRVYKYINDLKLHVTAYAIALIMINKWTRKYVRARPTMSFIDWSHGMCENRTQFCRLTSFMNGDAIGFAFLCTSVNDISSNIENHFYSFNDNVPMNDQTENSKANIFSSSKLTFLIWIDAWDDEKFILLFVVFHWIQFSDCFRLKIVSSERIKCEQMKMPKLKCVICPKRDFGHALDAVVAAD